MTTKKITFDYRVPASLVITMPLVRKTLRDVQTQLLSHDINGGGKKLNMNSITEVNSCGMAACLGGWTSLFLLGFEKSRDLKLEDPADELFEILIELDTDVNGGSGLRGLFYDYGQTLDYDTPNVAATAIGRYLRGNAKPWPDGEMPNILPYTKQARAKK